MIPNTYSLMAKYEFKELNEDKANLLLRQTGTDKIAKGPMTLADIYNYHKQEYNIKPYKNQIGFKVA